MKPLSRNNLFVNCLNFHKNIVRLVVALCIGLALWAWMGNKAQVGAQTQSDRKIIIKLGHLNATSAAIHAGSVKFAELVAQKTGGRAEVHLFPSSQLGNSKSQLQGVSLGGQDIYVESPVSFVNYDKDWMPFFLGFTYKNREQLIKVLNSKVGKELEEQLLKKSGIRVAAYWWKGDRHLISRKAITSVNDMKHVKMRVPNKTAFVTWLALGAQPVVVPWSELFIALQQGVVDAAEAPIGDLYTQRLHEPARHITLTSHEVTVASVSVSEKLFQTWPVAIQTAVLEAAREAAETQNRFLLGQEKDSMQKIKASGGTIHETNVEEWVAKVSHLPERSEADGLWSKGLWARIQAAKK